MKFTTHLAFVLGAIAISGAVHAQMTLKKAAPAAEPTSASKSSPDAAAPAPKPAARQVNPARAKIEAPVAKPAPAVQPAGPSAEKVLRNAAAALKKQSEAAKTNADLAKLVAAADVKIDLSLPGAAVIEPVTVYFVEQQGFLGGLFGAVKSAAKTNNDDPSTLRTKDGRKVLDSVKMASQLRIPGATDEVIQAAMEYAHARGEIVDLEVWVGSEVEAMTLQNKFAATPIVRSIKVKPGKTSRFVFLLPAEGSVREMKTVYITAESQGVQGTPTAGSASSGNAPELCPDASNFFTRGICEANTCKERPELAGHPTCVKVREMEAAREQQRM